MVEQQEEVINYKSLRTIKHWFARTKATIKRRALLEKFK